MNLTSEGLRRLESILGGHVARGSIPGLVALVSQGEATHVIVDGRMSLDDPEPMRRDSIFRIASMTKPVTAIAALMLIEAGKLRLEEPVDPLLPELANRRVLRTLASPVDDTVPAARPITVEDVLTFRLGLGVLFDPDLPIQGLVSGLPGFGMPDPTCPLTPDAYMQRLRDVPLMSQPGERWLYTVSSNVLGVLVARAAGKPSYGCPDGGRRNDPGSRLGVGIRSGCGCWHQSLWHFSRRLRLERRVRDVVVQ
jgi:CubicO group peptidase (beta-lactamase class C family)